MGSDLWFYYYSQARGEGLNESDAEAMATSNTKSHFLNGMDDEQQDTQELAIRDIRRQAK